VIELLLLDRDGVINKKIENGYVTNASQLSFIESTFVFLERNKSHFKHIGVVTNQQGIGKKLFTLDDLADVHNFVSQKFSECNLTIPVYFVCPHLSGLCECRKPKPKLIHDAIQFFDSNPKATLMIGDSLSDVEASKSAGINVIHLDSQCNKKSCVAVSHNLTAEVFHSR
jgi:D-glycero-D-manno-heptose 1,7-bisphosphate phosphatase